MSPDNCGWVKHSSCSRAVTPRKGALAGTVAIGVTIGGNELNTFFPVATFQSANVGVAMSSAKTLAGPRRLALSNGCILALCKAPRVPLKSYHKTHIPGPNPMSGALGNLRGASIGCFLLLS